MAELARGFLCRRCGDHHTTLPLSYSVKAPLTVMRVPPAERQRRVVISPDQCVIDDRLFFLRGRIVIAVHGIEDPFVWGVWAQVASRDFFRTHQLWKTAGREREAAFPGRLDTDLKLFGTTADLPVRVQTQVVGRRPHFIVAEEHHPLGVEQRAGITLGRAEEIAALLLHPEGDTLRRREYASGS